MHSGEFLGLSSGKADLSWTLPVVDEICSGAGSIFGGAALGAAISALEMAAERPLVWATGQFISYSKPPEEITVDVTIRAAGKGTTQAFCLAHVDGRPVIEVMAALGNRDSALHNSWVERLEVPAPDDCPVSTFLSDRPTISSRFERRLARGNLDRDNDPAVPDGRSALWFKIPDELDVDAGVLGILGDYVPFGAPYGHRAATNQDLIYQPRQHDPSGRACADYLGAGRRTDLFDHQRLLPRNRAPLGRGRHPAGDGQSNQPNAGSLSQMPRLGLSSPDATGGCRSFKGDRAPVADLIPAHRFGALLAETRLAHGMDLDAIAVQSGGIFTAAELAMIETGNTVVREDVLPLLSKLYRVPCAEVVPHRAKLCLDVGARYLRVAGHETQLESVQHQAILDRYLSLLYLVRDIEPGSAQIPLRGDDLAVSRSIVA